MKSYYHTVTSHVHVTTYVAFFIIIKQSRRKIIIIINACLITQYYYQASVYQGRGGQSLKLSTKATIFKRVSLLIGGPKHVDWGGPAPWPPLGAGPLIKSFEISLALSLSKLLCTVASLKLIEEIHS